MNAGLGFGEYNCWLCRTQNACTVKGPAVSAMEAMDPMMGAMMSGGPMSNPDPSKAFGQEADSWKLMVSVEVRIVVDDYDSVTSSLFGRSRQSRYIGAENKLNGEFSQAL